MNIQENFFARRLFIVICNNIFVIKPHIFYEFKKIIKILKKYCNFIKNIKKDYFKLNLKIE